MKRAFFIIITLLTLLLSSCGLRSVTVTVYNSTRLTTGTLTILYGDYQAQYAEGGQDFYSVSFPFVYTIENPSAHPSYIVYAEYKDSSGNLASGGLLLDTTMGAEKNIAIDLSLYKINASTVDDYEADNTFETAGVIQGGEYQARSLNNSADDDYVSFYAVSGRKYVVDGVIHNNYSMIQMWLYDPSHTQLAYDSYNGGYSSGGASIEWNASYTGVCYIKISSDYSTLSYRLGLSWYTITNNVKAEQQLFKDWSRSIK